MAKSRKGDEWPSPYEYDQAMLKHRETISDPDIKNSQLLRMTEAKPARLNAAGSQYVCVYRLENWIMRCFASESFPDKPEVKPPDDIVERYQGILSYLEQPDNTLPCLVRHHWVEEQDEGILVRGIYFPFLKLRYIDPPRSLGQFLTDHYEELKGKKQLDLFSRIAEELAQQWLQVAQQLESKHIAHGDLDTSNILVRGTYPSLSLILIDYDGMYVPSFDGRGMKTTDKGHWNFQPAVESLRVFGPELDRFSSLIIYLSLLALKIHPQLWEDCGGSESSLLLGGNDYEQLGQSKNFMRLYQASEYDTHLRNCLNELETTNGKRMPRSLGEILFQEYAIQPVQPDKPVEAKPLLEPVGWAGQAAAAQPAPQQPQSPFYAPPPPSPGYQWQPSPPAQPPYGQAYPPPRYRPAPGRTNWGLLFAIIFIVIVILLIVIIALHNQQHSSSGYVVLVALAPWLAHDDGQMEEANGQQRNPGDA